MKETMKAELFPKDPNGLDFNYESKTSVKDWLKLNASNVIKSFRKIIFKGRAAYEFSELVFDKNPLALKLINCRTLQVQW